MNIRLLFLLMLTLSCNENYYEKYAVVSATKEATNAGIKILEQGGNAFDAMIAVDLALAVTYMEPVGSVTGRPAPIAAAMGSSIRKTRRAPALSADS